MKETVEITGLPALLLMPFAMLFTIVVCLIMMVGAVVLYFVVMCAESFKLVKGLFVGAWKIAQGWARKLR